MTKLTLLPVTEIPEKQPSTGRPLKELTKTCQVLVEQMKITPGQIFEVDRTRKDDRQAFNHQTAILRALTRAGAKCSTRTIGNERVLYAAVPSE